MRFLGRLLRFWVLIVFLCLSGYFAIYNQERVFMHFPPWLESINLPIYVLFMLAFILGATIVIAFFGVEHMKNILKVRKLNKKLETIESLSSNSSSRTSISQSEPVVNSQHDSIDEDV